MTTKKKVSEHGLDTRLRDIYSQLNDSPNAIAIKSGRDGYLTPAGLENDFYIALAINALEEGYSNERVKIWDGQQIITVHRLDDGEDVHKPQEPQMRPDPLSERLQGHAHLKEVVHDVDTPSIEPAKFIAENSQIDSHQGIRYRVQRSRKGGAVQLGDAMSELNHHANNDG